MNKSLSVFLSVLLCIVLYVGVLLLRYTTDESDYWQSSQVYTSSVPAGAPVVSFGVGANGDVLAVPMSSRYSSRERYLQPSWRSTGVANLQGFSRSANSTGMLSHPSLQGGDGGRLFTHMSSSQTMKSFGGGNSSAGVSVSGGVVSSNSQSPIANTQLAVQGGGLNGITTSSPNNLITSSPTSLLALSPNNLITSSPLASNYQGLGNAAMGDPRGIRGRKNLGIDDDNVEDSWLNWLALMGINIGDVGHYDESTNTWYYDYYDLQKLYQEFCNNWNYGMGKKPTWDEWLAWFMGSEGNPYIWDDGDSQYGFSFVPVGDFMPLIVFALLYVVLMVYRRRQCRMINSSEDVE